MLESTADDLDTSALAVGLAERSSVEPLWVYNFFLHFYNNRMMQFISGSPKNS